MIRKGPAERGRPEVGPLLDRIAVHVEVPAIAYEELRGRVTPSARPTFASAWPTRMSRKEVFWDSGFTTNQPLHRALADAKLRGDHSYRKPAPSHRDRLLPVEDDLRPAEFDPLVLGRVDSRLYALADQFPLELRRRRQDEEQHAVGWVRLAGIEALARGDEAALSLWENNFGPRAMCECRTMLANLKWHLKIKTRSPVFIGHSRSPAV